MVMDSPSSTGRLQRLYQRIVLSIGRGRINTVNDAGPVQLVQVTLNDREVRDTTPRVAEFGFASNPPEGTDCILLFVGGERSNGVVIGTNHQSSRPKNLQPGEVMVFDLWGKSVYFTASGGIIVDAKNTDVTVNNATTVTINAATEVQMNTPILRVSGDVLDNCNTNQHTVAQMRSIYNGHDHVITGIQTGSSQVNSNVPAQTQ